MNGPIPSDGQDLLDFAEERIFSLGPRDLGSALSYRNMRFGIGKMIYASGSEDVHCILAPDASITRNRERWFSGFGYGGVIRWDDENLAFPQIKPNACGMILVQLNDLPEEKELIERASAVNETELSLNGIEIDPDFGSGNHFFEFYEPLEISESFEYFSHDSYYAILHCSAPELKDEVYSYIGKGRQVQTPLGEITVLEGKEAERYRDKWEKMKTFARKRRRLLAEEVLGSYNYRIISNYLHQGLFSETEARLGCYDTQAEYGENIYPVTLRWDCPVYIFEGKKNLSENLMKRLEFQDRAKKLGLEESLLNANILPHGGGYKVKLSYQNVETTDTDFGKVFTLSNPEPFYEEREGGNESDFSDFGKMCVTSPGELPYTYRGKGVSRKIMEFDLSDLVAKLKPVTTLKV
ncbi:hypothetical protein AKJ40_01010 [candidate division MSBL1 archaeon SCGC-AAA259M10]|uniref:Uncharacterized protein n=2 Tax=candidate division MSBL1 TaxID=215777 RepID=A0A133V2K5_9EURY|nr:hypothetical protein AKJ36_00680 [candidate division MSBL1 archaeon SCGC-AAA259I07]KXB00655.1 hypothetical protein AKJ40_01010 [candidate division MSBL1 archaeon SCGC-AAA259M10]